MNDDKTEVLAIGSASKLKSVSGLSSFTIAGNNIPFSNKARDLGVILDSHLSMDNQINAVCRSVFSGNAKDKLYWKISFCECHKNPDVSFCFISF